MPGDIADRVRDVLAARPEQRGGGPTYAVIPSTHTSKKAEAVFRKALTRVLSRPPAIDWGWADNDQFIHASDLAVAVEIEVCETIMSSMWRQVLRSGSSLILAIEASCRSGCGDRRRRLEAAEKHFVACLSGRRDRGSWLVLQRLHAYLEPVGRLAQNTARGPVVGHRPSGLGEIGSDRAARNSLGRGLIIFNCSARSLKVILFVRCYD